MNEKFHEKNLGTANLLTLIIEADINQSPHPSSVNNSVIESVNDAFTIKPYKLYHDNYKKFNSYFQRVFD